MRSLGEGLRLAAWSLALVATVSLACCASGPKAPPRIATSSYELGKTFEAARGLELTARKEGLSGQDWQTKLETARRMMTDAIPAYGESSDTSPLLLTKIGDLALLEASLPGLDEHGRGALLDEADRNYQRALDAYLGWSPALVGRARVARERGGEGAFSEAASFLELARDRALPMLREDLGLEAGAPADPFAVPGGDQEVAEARQEMSRAMEMYESWPADSLAPSIEFGSKAGIGAGSLLDRLEARVVYEQGLLAARSGRDPTDQFKRAARLDEAFYSAKLQIAGWLLARSRDMGDQAALEQLKFAEMWLPAFISCDGRPAVERDLPALQLLASIYVEQIRRGGPRQFECAQQVVDEMNTRFPDRAEGALFAAELKLGRAMAADEHGTEWKKLLLEAEWHLNDAAERPNSTRNDGLGVWSDGLLARIQRAREG